MSNLGAFFVAYGERVLAFITGCIGLLSTQALQPDSHLGISAITLAWLTFVGSMTTLAISTFYSSEQKTAAKTKLRGPKP